MHDQSSTDLRVRPGFITGPLEESLEIAEAPETAPPVQPGPRPFITTQGILITAYLLTIILTAGIFAWHRNHDDNGAAAAAPAVDTGRD